MGPGQTLGGSSQEALLTGNRRTEGRNEEQGPRRPLLCKGPVWALPGPARSPPAHSLPG